MAKLNYKLLLNFGSGWVDHTRWISDSDFQLELPGFAEDRRFASKTASFGIRYDIADPSVSPYTSPNGDLYNALLAANGHIGVKLLKPWAMRRGYPRKTGRVLKIANTSNAVDEAVSTTKRAVEPNKPYSIFFRGRIGTASLTQLVGGVNWFTEAGVYINTSVASITPGAHGTGWAEATLTGNSPTNARYASVAMATKDQTAGTAWVDSLVVTHAGRLLSDDFDFVGEFTDWILSTGTEIVDDPVNAWQGDSLEFTGEMEPPKTRTTDGTYSGSTLWCSASDTSRLLKKKLPPMAALRNVTLMNPASPSTSIVHILANAIGWTGGFGVVDIPTSFTVWAPVNEDDTVFTILDTLLYEHGWALSIGKDGTITPVQTGPLAPTVTAVTDSDLIRNLSIRESLVAFDGGRVTSYALAERPFTRVYTEDLPYSDDGRVWAGYSIPAGTVFPARANAYVNGTSGPKQQVYQEYSDAGIKYFTNKAITDKALEGFNRDAFDSDFTDIVATGSHVIVDKYDAGILRGYADANGNFVQENPLDNDATAKAAQFKNKKAQVLYYNPTGSPLKLYYSYIMATVTYRQAKREATINNVSDATRVQEYEASYLYDALGTGADRFLQIMAARHEAGNAEYSFTSKKTFSPGDVLSLQLADGTSQQIMVASGSIASAQDLVEIDSLPTKRRVTSADSLIPDNPDGTWRLWDFATSPTGWGGSNDCTVSYVNGEFVVEMGRRPSSAVDTVVDRNSFTVTTGWAASTGSVTVDSGLIRLNSVDSASVFTFTDAMFTPYMVFGLTLSSSVDTQVTVYYNASTYTTFSLSAGVYKTLPAIVPSGYTGGNVKIQNITAAGAVLSISHIHFRSSASNIGYMEYDWATTAGWAGGYTGTSFPVSVADGKLILGTPANGDGFIENMTSAMYKIYPLRHRFILLKMRRMSGTGSSTLMVFFNGWGPGAAKAYNVPITEGAIGEWKYYYIDMHASADWKSFLYLTHLRFDIGNPSTSTYEIGWIGAASTYILDPYITNSSNEFIEANRDPIVAFQMRTDVPLASGGSGYTNGILINQNAGTSVYHHYPLEYAAGEQTVVVNLLSNPNATLNPIKEIRLDFECNAGKGQIGKKIYFKKIYFGDGTLLPTKFDLERITSEYSYKAYAYKADSRTVEGTRWTSVPELDDTSNVVASISTAQVSVDADGAGGYPDLRDANATVSVLMGGMDVMSSYPAPTVTAVGCIASFNQTTKKLQIDQIPQAATLQASAKVTFAKAGMPTVETSLTVNKVLRPGTAQWPSQAQAQIALLFDSSALDSSGRGRNAILGGATAYEAGKTGSRLVTSGGTGYAQITGLSNISWSAPWTLVARVSGVLTTGYTTATARLTLGPSISGFLGISYVDSAGVSRTLSTDKPFDTNPHEYAIRFDGTTLFLRIDDRSASANVALKADTYDIGYVGRTMAGAFVASTVEDFRVDSRCWILEEVLGWQQLQKTFTTQATLDISTVGTPTITADPQPAGTTLTLTWKAIQNKAYLDSYVVEFSSDSFATIAATITTRGESASYTPARLEPTTANTWKARLRAVNQLGVVTANTSAVQTSYSSTAWTYLLSAVPLGAADVKVSVQGRNVTFKVKPTTTIPLIGDQGYMIVISDNGGSGWYPLGFGLTGVDRWRDGSTIYPTVGATLFQGGLLTHANLPLTGESDVVTSTPPTAKTFRYAISRVGYAGPSTAFWYNTIDATVKPLANDLAKSALTQAHISLNDWLNQQPIQQGLISHWPMEGVTTDLIKDLGSRGSHLGPKASPSLGTSAVNGESVNTTNGGLLGLDTGLPSGAAPRSMSAWVYPMGTTGGINAPIVGWGTWGTNYAWNGLTWNCNAATGSLYFVMYSDDLLIGSNLALNKWYHAGVSFDGTTVSIYLNGTLVGSIAKPINTILNGRVALGMLNNTDASLTRPMPGMIDEIRVYNRALTEAEFRYLYLQPGGPVPNMIGADRIIARSITSEEIAAKTITTAELAVGQITDGAPNWGAASIDSSLNYWYLADAPGGLSAGSFRVGTNDTYIQFDPDAEVLEIKAKVIFLPGETPVGLGNLDTTVVDGGFLQTVKISADQIETGSVKSVGYDTFDMGAGPKTRSMMNLANASISHEYRDDYGKHRYAYFDSDQFSIRTTLKDMSGEYTTGYLLDIDSGTSTSNARMWAMFRPDSYEKNLGIPVDGWDVTPRPLKESASHVMGNTYQMLTGEVSIGGALLHGSSSNVKWTIPANTVLTDLTSSVMNAIGYSIPYQKMTVPANGWVSLSAPGLTGTLSGFVVGIVKNPQESPFSGYFQQPASHPIEGLSVYGSVPSMGTLYGDPNDAIPGAYGIMITGAKGTGVFSNFPYGGVPKTLVISAASAYVDYASQTIVAECVISGYVYFNGLQFDPTVDFPSTQITADNHTYTYPLSLTAPVIGDRYPMPDVFMRGVVTTLSEFPHKTYLVTRDYADRRCAQRTFMNIDGETFTIERSGLHYFHLVGAGGGGGGGYYPAATNYYTGSSGSPGIQGAYTFDLLKGDVVAFYSVRGTGGDGGSSNAHGTNGSTYFTISRRNTTSQIHEVIFTSGNFGGLGGKRGASSTATAAAPSTPVDTFNTSKTSFFVGSVVNPGRTGNPAIKNTTGLAVVTGASTKKVTDYSHEGFPVAERNWPFYTDYGLMWYLTNDLGYGRGGFGGNLSDTDTDPDGDNGGSGFMIIWF